jgi:hypothetical protein
MSSLVPEKPLLVYPQLAQTLGLEEALMLAALSERCQLIQGVQSGKFLWFRLDRGALLSIFPFWNVRDLQRIATNLREKGVLIINSAPLEQSEHFRFAFNEAVQEQMAAQPTPTPAARPRAETHSSFLSKNYIAPNWQPDETTLTQLAQHSIPSSFALQQVPEFVTYWYERKEKQHSWGSKFIQHTLRQWREYQAAQHVKEQEHAMNSGWQPSIDAWEILTEQGGVKREFIEDAIPEFVLYWRERGDKHRTWNSKFVQHVRTQWIKYNAAIEHSNIPRAIAAQWQPSEDVFDVLRLANIDIAFAKSLIPEFVLYWRDRGDLNSSWNTKYLQHVKRCWANRLSETANEANRSTRDLSLEELLTDRSWAD